MNDVRFLDFEFNRLGEFSKHTSVNFVRKYCGFGTAEVHFPVSVGDVIGILNENDHLMFAYGDNVAVVTGWKIGEDIAVFGRTLEWLLTKRGVGAFSVLQMSAENIARKSVVDAAGDFVVQGEVCGAGELMDYSTDEVKVLHDLLCDILEPCGLGFEVNADFENKQFVFRVYSGEERRVLVSPSNRTAHRQVYTVEKQNAVSDSGWYLRKYLFMGDWNAEKNNPTLHQGRQGNFYKYYKISVGYKDRFDMNCVEGEYLYCDNENGMWNTCVEKPVSGWVYKANASVEGAKRWDAVLKGAKTVSEASLEISKMAVRESSSMETCHIDYGVDYCLGDVLVVQTEFGDFRKTEKKRVTSVNIYYDVNGNGVAPVFGD